MKDKIYDELKKVIDPEIGFDVVSLGLIYDVLCEGEKATITMTLSTKSCPLHELIVSWIKEAALRVVSECEINLVWEPAWNISMATQEVRDSLK